jgi:hypothetical protein
MPVAKAGALLVAGGASGSMYLIQLPQYSAKKYLPV